MIETKITRDYSKLKFVSIVTVALSVVAYGTVYAFSASDAGKINAITKKMAVVAEDIAVSEMKLSDLDTKRSIINEKMKLVQNHIDVQNEALISFKKEIRMIIDGKKIRTGDKRPEKCYYPMDEPDGWGGTQLMFLFEDETCDEALERVKAEKSFQ